MSAATIFNKMSNSNLKSHNSITSKASRRAKFKEAYRATSNLKVREINNL